MSRSAYTTLPTSAGVLEVVLAAAHRGDPDAYAAVLGKRPGAVRTAAHRGLRTLAHHLSQT